MTPADLLPLAYCVASPGDYSPAEALAIRSGRPPAAHRAEGDAWFRRLLAAGLVEPRRVVLADRGACATGPAQATGLQGDILAVLRAAPAASVEALGRALVRRGSLCLGGDGRPPSRFYRALARLRELGAVEAGAVVPTPAGVLAVEADPAARRVLDGERDLLAASRARTERVRAIHARVAEVLRQAQVETMELDARMVRRARSEPPGRVGLPGRTRWDPVARRAVQGGCET